MDENQPTSNDNMIRPPFTKYNLEEEEQPGRTFTVRINPQEDRLLNEIKTDLDIKSDSKALKEAAWVGLNVLHQTFGREFLRYLFKKERARLSDYKNFKAD